MAAQYLGTNLSPDITIFANPTKLYFCENPLNKTSSRGHMQKLEIYEYMFTFNHY